MSKMILNIGNDDSCAPLYYLIRVSSVPSLHWCQLVSAQLWPTLCHCHHQPQNTRSCILPLFAITTSAHQCSTLPGHGAAFSSWTLLAISTLLKCLDDVKDSEECLW